jgi:predicted nucleic acid-binding protein
MRVVIDTNVFVSAALKQTSMPALAVRVVRTARGIA